MLLIRYYLSGTDAFRLKLLLPPLPAGAGGDAAAASRTEAEREARRLVLAEADQVVLRMEAMRVES